MYVAAVVVVVVAVVVTFMSSCCCCCFIVCYRLVFLFLLGRLHNPHTCNKMRLSLF